MGPEEFAVMERLHHTHWWLRGRRFVVRALFRKFASAGGSFLDLGCGAGEGMSIVDSASTLAGMDISDDALALAKNKGYASLQKGSGECLPFADNSFDGILMLDVLEHIDDDRATIRECHRVLVGSGVLLLTVPAYPWLWSGHDEIYGHKRRYTKTALVHVVESAGLRIAPAVLPPRAMPAPPMPQLSIAYSTSGSRNPFSDVPMS